MLLWDLFTLVYHFNSILFDKLIGQLKRFNAAEFYLTCWSFIADIIFIGAFSSNCLGRNLPEVRSAHEVLGIPTVSARFGTAPFFWNWGMSAMTNLLPPVRHSFRDGLLLFMSEFCLSRSSAWCSIMDHA